MNDIVNEGYFKQSETIGKLTEALTAFNKQVGKVEKDAENPFFNSKFASISSILKAISKPLSDNGLAITQFPLGKNGLLTSLSHVSGEFIQGAYYMTPKDTSPQSSGSLISYQRRYALKAILNLNDEDDDGNSVSRGRKGAKTSAQTKKDEEVLDF